MEGVDEGAMMQQAQHIWTMLDEMADNDPQAYRKFIDKHTKEGKEYMKPPEPHMCVQTMMIEPRKRQYFINFCSWNRVPEPKSPEDPVPVSGTSVQDDKSSSEEFSYSSVAFSPKILEEYGRDTKSPEDRRTLINLAIDYIHHHQKVKLSRSFTLLGKDILFKGNLKLIENGFRKHTENSDKKFEDQLSELEKSFGPLGPGAKDTLLSKLSNLSSDDSGDIRGVKSHSSPSNRDGEIKLPSQTKSSPKPGLITEITTDGDDQTSLNGNVNNLPCPKYTIQEHKDTSGKIQELVVRIEMPGVSSVAQCELDISEDDIQLEVEEMYYLHIRLPCVIQENDAAAKFNKKTSCLTITLPAELSES